MSEVRDPGVQVRHPCAPAQGYETGILESYSKAPQVRHPCAPAQGYESSGVDVTT